MLNVYIMRVRGAKRNMRIDKEMKGTRHNLHVNDSVDGLYGEG